MSGGARKHRRVSPRLIGYSAYDQRILSDNPVMFLTLSGGSSGAIDRTGHGHNGLLVNTPTTTLMPNSDSATLFDGSSQYVEVANHLNLSIPKTGVITLEAWLRPDTLEFPHSEATGYVHWMGKGMYAGQVGLSQTEYMARMYSYTNTETPPRPNRISGYAFNLAGGLGAGSYFQDTVSVGEWIYYVLVINTVTTNATYPTGYTKLYKNGTERDKDSMSDYGIIPAHGTSPFRIATVDFVSFFKGAIGKVALYDYELSAQSINEHYRLVVPPAGGAGYLQIDLQG